MSSNGSHNGHLSASSLRARLRHPVIDADGHWRFGPIVREQLRKIGGDRAVEFHSSAGKSAKTVDVRGRACSSRCSRPLGRAHQKYRDRPPPLCLVFYERMEELGLDFTVLYPTAGWASQIPDTELRRITCRP